MKPFFSIVISLYNKEQHIKATLESVFSQTFQDFEIILVNDGSTDKSLEIANAFDDKRLTIYTRPNNGASATRNYGISTSKGQFVALLDGDDFWANTYLQTIHDTILAFPTESVFATAIAHKYDEKIVPMAYNFELKESAMVLDYFKNSLKHSILTSSSIVLKKESFETTGLFDTNIKSGQDTDLWIRVGLHYPIVFIPHVLAFYVYSPTSLSNTTFNLDAKPKYDKYQLEETQHPDLKKLLDINRYSLAVMSKLYDNEKAFNFYKSHISLKNLSLKQRLLINAPKWLLELLLKLKSLKGQKLYYKPL